MVDVEFHGDFEFTKDVTEALFEVEPENPATYVTLINMLGEVAKVRNAMDDKGLVKKPGLRFRERYTYTCAT